MTYVSNKLYINPKGSAAKNVQPKLDCVGTLVNHPSGFNYVARFSYINQNATAVYVPIGGSNSITGTYSGQQPTVFQPGGGTFEIYFNGSSLPWKLSTYNGNSLVSCTVTATSASTSCGAPIYTRGAMYGSGNETALAEKKEASIVMPAISNSGIIVYPNPVVDKLVLQTDGLQISPRELIIMDISGKIYRNVNIRKTGPNLHELNMALLPSGIYLLKLKSGDDSKTVKILKQ